MDKKKILERLQTPKAVRWFWIILCAPVALILLLLLLTRLGAFGKLPTFEELENPKSNLATEIYSDDGEMIGSFFIQNRSYVDYNELSPALVAALISTEDMRFYSHSGIDFISLARVAVKTLALGNRRQGGGSTITQQLAKNLYPRDTAVYNNPISKGSKLVISKLKEWITAVMLEYNYTKEEIITMYLNTVPYGSNAYGIKSAARTFFNKLPSELNVQEAAMLVGVVNAPTRYSPRSNPDRALARRNTVISRMREKGYLTRAQRDSIQALPIELDFRPISHNAGTGTYFREMLRMVMTSGKPSRESFGPGAAGDWDYRQAVEQWESNPLYGWCDKNVKANGQPYDLYRDGLKIYTTVNATMQRYAEQAVWEQMGETVQPMMDRVTKARGSVFSDISKDEREAIMRRAKKNSDRYRQMKRAGATDAEIDKAFATPVPMRVFSYKGDRDTVMSPDDSLMYYKKFLRASFMAVDPSNGYVKAYVGGTSYRYFKYDMAKQGRRQVGSTIKPFVYTFAIEQLDLTPCTQVPNLPVTIETDNEPWSPREALSGDFRLLAVRAGRGLRYVREPGRACRSDFRHANRGSPRERARELHVAVAGCHFGAVGLYDARYAQARRERRYGRPHTGFGAEGRHGRQDGNLAEELRRMVRRRDAEARGGGLGRRRGPEHPSVVRRRGIADRAAHFRQFHEKGLRRFEARHNGKGSVPDSGQCRVVRLRRVG